MTSFATPRVRKGMAVILAVLIVIAIVVVLLEVVVLRPRFQEAENDAHARAEVTRVAQRFTVEVNNYDAGSVDDYQMTISPLLTAKFKGEFEKAVSDLVQQVKQAKMTSTGKVLASAVASVDPDSAEVLVVADADVKTVYDTRQRHFRWQVTLVKVGGTWLVDDFTPVA